MFDMNSNINFNTLSRNERWLMRVIYRKVRKADWNIDAARAQIAHHMNAYESNTDDILPTILAKGPLVMKDVITTTNSEGS